ncbi:MAG: ABC transporter ATP-binding protein [Lachnospiraceae bacterium]|nr:ABC transporter ATP-binding protein [Lachnospiraceae bacterium]
MGDLLSLNHVSYSYHSLTGETPALTDISFGVPDGEFLAIVGPSGCGKSTLLSLIAGLLPPSSGNIQIKGKNLSDQDLHIGYMLQKDHLLDWRTTYRNLALGLEIQKKDTPENLAKIDELLKAYGLAAFRDAKPSSLSGGMRQRAALIRTLVLNPDLLLLDEPFSALDYQTRITVSDDIWQIIRKEKKTAILITHDISEAVSMSDRVIVLSKRPGTIRAIIEIQLSPGNRSPIKARSDPKFKDYFNQIWKELTDHEI